MGNFLEKLIDQIKKNDFSYPRYFRQRAILLKKDEYGKGVLNELKQLDAGKPSLSKKLQMEFIDKLSLTKKEFIKVLMHKDSYTLLWVLNDIEVDGISLLDCISPIIEKLSQIKRGGINTYKMNGWMVHVLYGYQILNFDIPRGLPPDTVEWDKYAFDAFGKLKEIYEELSPLGKFILRLGYFCHDIGVVDGVQNHDIKGEKYVNDILEHLNIADSILSENEIELDTLEVTEITKLAVVYHPFINRVSGEASDQEIKDELTKIRQNLQRAKIKDFFYGDFAKILLLIGIADLIAVDDTLFSREKFETVYESFDFINSFIQGREIERPIKQIAIKRLREMVYEKYFTDLEHVTEMELKKYNFDSSEFYYMLYHIRAVEYGVGILKPLNNPSLTVKALVMLFTMIKNTLGVEATKNTKIVFDSGIEIEAFKKAIMDRNFKAMRCNETAVMDKFGIKMNILDECSVVKVGQD